ncbi:hypothetical protein [Noviherbaspirillum suwonense]|uniref:Phage integrase, N-terminal SAM-like domain n=1 Tax=Noviherbaspirillum suwonense TaxID=1224511 RepID=A0ABY1QK06_9BURK|nr:hypothetical protein [Noviherbaspirillum suwonense]SMP73107.1 Phage integrase, N-terminal SAM-like domain [Noviherbaspirillum suwonense]
MAQDLVIINSANPTALPALFTPTPQAAKRILEFFMAQIRNPNTRRDYVRAVSRFASWRAEHGLNDLQDVEPIHVAADIETLLL